MAKSEALKFDGEQPATSGRCCLPSSSPSSPSVSPTRTRWCFANARRPTTPDINGRQLKFIGTATGLFFTWLKRLVLTIVALGIYLFWAMPRLNKWIVEHTGFARPEPQTSGDSSVQSHHT